MLRTHLKPAGVRRGNILIVTLLLLALFATIGLTIVYYTKDLSERQRVNIEAQSTGGTVFPDDGSVSFNTFLSNLIYDSPAPGPYTNNMPTSAIWGHSLMRTMYGGVANNNLASPAIGNAPYPNTATIPWSGIGSFHEPVPAAGGLDRASIVNMMQVWQTGQRAWPEITNANIYVPKNAPYTYPDLKDFYLASFVPATGEVTVPSFYRAWLFKSASQTVLGPTGLPATGLEPPMIKGGNPNWLSATGRYMIARPRPGEMDATGLSYSVSTAFPYVPANADGTYTGDVQNIVGSYFYYPPTFAAAGQFAGQFVAHNDSMWMDVGIPPMTLQNGKTVKPMIAPLIVDLDALMNYNIHGNVLTTLAAGSGVGLGPWEVNIVRALSQAPTGVSDATNLIAGRGQPQTVSGFTTRGYNKYSGQQLPAYSALPWDTGAGAAPNYLQLAGEFANSYYANIPNYNPSSNPPNFYTGFDSTNTPVPYPAMLYNPNEWPLTNTPSSAANATPQPYSPADLQFLLAQYCGAPASYNTPSTGYNPLSLPSLGLNNLSPQSIRGSGGTTGTATQFPYPPYPSLQTPPTPVPTAYQLSVNGFRLDPANVNRGLLTPYSWSLDMPGLSPNYLNLTAANALTLNPGSMLTGGVLTNTLGQFQYPINPNGAAVSDYTSNRQMSNGRAALGPIDLNRPLADYRLTTAQPLSPTNMAPANVSFGATLASQAAIDRQQFAMSIFVRLVVASGADGSYQVLPGIGESIMFPGAAPFPGSPTFNALRTLAQLAANIVDYIDSDDISTPFVWNPLNPQDPLNAANFNSLTMMGQHVVFGVEKPRLVLNEAFAEMTNPPTEPALTNQNARAGQAGPNSNPYIRFWVELQNPTSNAYNGGNGPLGTGSVSVRYPVQGYSPYLVQIVRSTPGGGVNVSDMLRDPINPGNAANVTGAIANVAGFGGLNPVPADLTFDFSTGVPAQLVVNPANPSNAAPNSVGSILVLAPAPYQSPLQGAPDWNPAGGGNWSPLLGVNVITASPPAAGTTTSLTSNTLQLATAINPNNGQVQPALNQNIVLLRRLANPYLPPNDPNIGLPGYFNPANPVINPFITVDYMDYVPVTDQVSLLFNQTLKNKRTAGAESAVSYPQLPMSLGKVQPYTSWTPINGTFNPTWGTYQFTFPNSLVLPQMYQPPPAGATGQTPMHTFGYANVTNPLAPPQTATYVPAIKPPGNGNTAVLNGTLMLPSDWFPHLDRQLINQSELLTVSMGKPHEYTLRSITPNLTGSDVQKFYNTAGATISGLNGANTTLYRAQDVLRIQPYGHMTPLGGRVPGRVNLNTIQDKRVWDSVFDAQGWNTFAQTDVTTLWYQMLGITTAINPRTAVSVKQPSNQRYTPSGIPLTDTSGIAYATPIPGNGGLFSPTGMGWSVYDTTATSGDRPFLPFGAPTYTGSANPTTGAYFGGVGLLTDTLGRNASIIGVQTPFQNTGALPTQPPYNNVNGTLMPHPYVQTEALRKIMNSTTTTSHTFAVWVTVGYFDFNRPTPTSSPVLGAEYYSVIPGDLRRKYFAVVDRSMVGLDPSSVLQVQQGRAQQALQSQNLPYFTTVAAPSTSTNGVFAIPALSTTFPITTSVTGSGSINSGTWSSSTSNTLVSSGGTTNIIAPIPTPQNGTYYQFPSGTNWIAIGTGATQEIVQVSPVINPKIQIANSGATVVTLATPTKYPHWPGEMVSNVIPGNPGPQVNMTPNFNIPGQVVPSNFDYAQPPYSYVVPFTVRLQ